MTTAAGQTTLGAGLPDRLAAHADLRSIVQLVGRAAHAGTPSLDLRRVQSAVADLHAALAEWAQAREVLADGEALPSTFPSGRPAPATLTPRQVVVLHATAPPTDLAALSDDEWCAEMLRRRRDQLRMQAAEDDLRSAVRSREATYCETPTAEGNPCPGWSLSFIARPACWLHATAEERDEQRRKSDAIREVVRQEFDR